jgi:hypothetical protein
MKYTNVLCICILAVSLPGCRRSPEGGASRREGRAPAPRVTRVATQAGRNQVSSSTGWEVQKDPAELPEVIERVFDDLGISVEQKAVKTGRCEYEARSPAGLTVTVDAVAVVKGSCFMRVGAEYSRGEEDVGTLLLEKVQQALRNAIAEQSQ